MAGTSPAMTYEVYDSIETKHLYPPRKSRLPISIPLWRRIA